MSALAAVVVSKTNLFPSRARAAAGSQAGLPGRCVRPARVGRELSGTGYAASALAG
jgi:hypothetical protein